MPGQRKRRIGSFKLELVRKSREAALAAVQSFNNPTITFKSEIYIVLMVIAWTYLLHAYFRDKRIDHRYYKERDTRSGTRKEYSRLPGGAFKYWDLMHCIDQPTCPLNNAIKNNLKFLIGLRNEIEHQMTLGLDNQVSAQFQACCINYNETLRNLFGDRAAIDSQLGVSLQFAGLERIQVESQLGSSALPSCARSYVEEFEKALTDDEMASPYYAYKTIMFPIQVNHRGQAHIAVEFVRAGTPEAEALNNAFVLSKVLEKQVLVDRPIPTSRPTYILKQITTLMHAGGHNWFGQHWHTQLCKRLEAKNPDKGYGGYVAERYWYWYDSWIEVVREHCQSESAQRTQSI